MKFKFFYLLFIISLTFYSDASISKEISTNSFDVNIEKIPKNYKGTNISELYSMLSKKVPINKSEFESSIEHEKKITEFISENILAIKLDPTDFYYTGGLHVKSYNADKELLQINIRTVALSESTHQDYRASLILKTLHKSAKTYVGSNAYGVKRNITDSEGLQYGIAIVNERFFGIKEHESNNKYESVLDSNRIFNSEFEISPTKAKVLKNNIAALILCKLALFNSKIKEANKYDGNNLFFEKDYYIPATLNNPQSSFYKRKYINVEALEIWIYDTSTGTILKKSQLNTEQ
jgi:hypothetical protein